jgi:hypothetical protein
VQNVAAHDAGKEDCEFVISSRNLITQRNVFREAEFSEKNSEITAVV